MISTCQETVGYRGDVNAERDEDYQSILCGHRADYAVEADVFGRATIFFACPTHVESLRAQCGDALTGVTDLAILRAEGEDV